MKKVCFYLLVLVSALLCCVGCKQNDVVQTGNIEISIEDNTSRGIQAVSMETASYNVTVRNSSGAVVLNSVNKTATYYSLSVPAGQYTAEVQALNLAGDVIGTGSASGEVTIGQNSRITVEVSEITGTGLLSIAVKGSEGYGLSYSVQNAAGAEVISGELLYSDGSYSGSVELQNGFYSFAILCNGESVLVETVRIIAGRTALFSSEISINQYGSFIIENKVSSTPDILVSFSAAEYCRSEILHASALIKGIEGTSFSWLVDGTAVSTSETYSDLELSLEGYSKGNHIVTLFVAEDGIVWSGDRTLVIVDEADMVYVRGDDAEIYDAVLGEYERLLDQAKTAATDSERFVIYAQAEACLLDSAVMVPYTTQGGAYTISRIAPRTTPFVKWGSDDDRWKGMLITADDFLTPAERDELLDIWADAVKGETTYDPEAWLIAHGHSINKEYKTTFSTAPVTLDILNTSSQSDTEILVNCTDNLVQYNNLGQMIPALAESWSVSADGITYTFHIRQGAWWTTSEGTKYAEVTARDFEAGFHHMLDAQTGLEWLVEGVIEGVSEYIYAGGKWDAVGYKAVDDYTLQVTLCAPTSYFMTVLTYSCFAPICESFYLAHGGVFGIEEYAAAYNDTNAYTYGKSTDVSSQVYNGAFILQQLNDSSIIKVVKNPNYYDPESVKLNSITWIYDNGENMAQFYKDVCDGIYAGCSLTSASGTLEWAKADGNYDKYAFCSETTSTTYFCALNLNRGTFELENGTCVSEKTGKQKNDTHTAMLNGNFRKAIAYAWDKATQNAVSRGADLATTNLRNMYTPPDYVQISESVTAGNGKEFVAGTLYGEIVQYYLEQLGSTVQVSDGIDGWYHPEEARSYLEIAKTELGNSVSWPITIDVIYYSANYTQLLQAQAFKQSIEGVLGAENVTVNLVGAPTSADFYASGYRASDGKSGNFDVFYGSGWGPDFGDPCTYLDTFRGNGAGYMTKTLGLF